jgi:hypothetical protein
MAHQRVRLGHNPNELLADFEKLRKLAEKQNQMLLQAKALQFQAQVRENEGTKSLLQNLTGRKPQAELNLQKARDLLTTALATLPAGKRGGFEEAELYELRGRMQKKREVFTLATNDYTQAWHIYNGLKGQANKNATRKDVDDGFSRTKKALDEIQLRPLRVPNGPDAQDSDEDDTVPDQPTTSNNQPPNTDLTINPKP